MQESRITRRRFVQTGLGAAAIGAASQCRAADQFGGFKVGAQSYTFRNFGLEQALKQMNEAGLKYGEFYRKHFPQESTPAQIKAILKLCGDYDVTPAGFGVARFTADHDANKRIFAFAQQLGVDYLSADPTEDSFDSLDKLVDEFEIAIAIHPHGPQRRSLHRWYSAEVIMKAVGDRHPLVGSCLDTGHLIRAAQPPFGKKLDPAQQIRVMGNRNFALHLKDHDNKTRHDVVFGNAALDVAAVVKALRDVNFTGTINIEYEAHPDNPLPDVKACLDVFKQAVAT